MSPTVKTIVIVIVIAALGGGAYAAFHKSGPNAAKPSSSTSSASTSSNNSSASSETTNPSASIAATITFTDSGFSPSTTSVKVGDTVQVTNKSSQPLDFESDPHPTHTDEPELNLGPVEAGKSKTFVVTKAGHWGFHDHLNPSMTGTLDVQ